MEGAVAQEVLSRSPRLGVWIKKANNVWNLPRTKTPLDRTSTLVQSCFQVFQPDPSLAFQMAYSLISPPSVWKAVI